MIEQRWLTSDVLVPSACGWIGWWEWAWLCGMCVWGGEHEKETSEPSVGVVSHKQRLLGCSASVSGRLVLPLSCQAVVLQGNQRKRQLVKQLSA